jgi:hypothetical protein
MYECLHFTLESDSHTINLIARITILELLSLNSEA